HYLTSLPSPTRRSSYLMLTFAQHHLADHAPLQCTEGDTIKTQQPVRAGIIADRTTRPELRALGWFLVGFTVLLLYSYRLDGFHRSEEHTSELQSPDHLV